MRIAVDVMGGDKGCGVVVAGVKCALKMNRKISELYLVGDEGQIREAVRECRLNDSRVQVLHASQVLTMHDKPVLGLRKKKDCSVGRAVGLVKEGKADAVISPGNTGGIVAASTIKLRPLDGVERAGIATVIPAPKNEFVLLDSGANVACKPIHLLHYGIMGSIYSREILGRERPRVGLLSVGTEEAKGNELTMEAFKLCKEADLNFIGNVEGHDLFSNRVDVVVCDGFVGNVVLKTSEGLAKSILSWIKLELMKTPIRRLGAMLAQGAFRPIKEHLDPDAFGGAPLLGVRGNVMITHGSAGERAIKNAILTATETIRHSLNDIIVQQVAAANERIEALEMVAPSSAMV